MDNQQYRNLMWHLSYVESLLENVAIATDGGGVCECPICKAKVPVFLPFGERIRKNALCPKCHSLERHRKLWLLMQKLDWHKQGMSVLHFAPEPVFHKLFSSFADIDYWPVDLNPKMRGVRKAVDITNITFDDETFDLIMCTHVLEHIPDDRKAMSELYRVLKKGGIALLNVPVFNRPQTLENPEYNTPELCSKYYGQFDHVRAYGLDYPQRLADANFKVHFFNELDEETCKHYGIHNYERIYWCTKE